MPNLRYFFSSSIRLLSVRSAGGSAPQKGVPTDDPLDELLVLVFGKKPREHPHPVVDVPVDPAVLLRLSPGVSSELGDPTHLLVLKQVPLLDELLPEGSLVQLLVVNLQDAQLEV